MTDQREAVIQVKGLKKNFGSLEVLKDISIEVNEGEVVAIIGPSGSGKSTLLNIIGCLDVAESGEYWLKGKKVTGKSQKEMAKIRNEIFGYVIQDFALIRDDTVLENIRIPLDYSKKKIDKLRIDQLLP